MTDFARTSSSRAQTLGSWIGRHPSEAHRGSESEKPKMNSASKNPQKGKKRWCGATWNIEAFGLILRSFWRCQGVILEAFGAHPAATNGFGGSKSLWRLFSWAKARPFSAILETGKGWFWGCVGSMISNLIFIQGFQCFPLVVVSIFQHVFIVSVSVLYGFSLFRLLFFFKGFSVFRWRFFNFRYFLIILHCFGKCFSMCFIISVEVSVLGSCQVSVWSFWGHFGLSWGSFWGHFGVSFGLLGGQIALWGSVLTQSRFSEFDAGQKWPFS